MLKSFSLKDKSRLFSCSLFWYQEVIIYSKLNVFFSPSVHSMYRVPSCGQNSFPDARSLRVHRNFISPPSLWPSCVLQKYHYPPVVSWRNTVASRILLLFVLLPGHTRSRYQQKNVSVRTIFCFQRSEDVFTYKEQRLFI